MLKSQVTKIMSAIEDAGIEEFMVVDDIFVRYYNNKTNSIVKVDEADEMFVCVRSNISTGGAYKAMPGNLEVVAVDFTDMHEIRVAGDYQHVSDFVDKLGLSLTDDELKLLQSIDSRNFSIIPETGDYNPSFVYLTPEQYEALTEEEKKEYDEAKRQYELKKNHLSQHFAASITC